MLHSEDWIILGALMRGEGGGLELNSEGEIYQNRER
jgi:hypothetical protein